MRTTEKCVMDENQLRDYFKICGLTYADLSELTIELLASIIQSEIMKQRAEIKETALVRVEPPKFTAKQHRTRNFAGIELTVKGTYFSHREAVTFNEDGFIGFCGWASGYHKAPFLIGFEKWCREVKSLKEKRAG